MPGAFRDHQGSIWLVRGALWDRHVDCRRLGARALARQRLCHHERNTGYIDGALSSDQHIRGHSCGVEPASESAEFCIRVNEFGVFDSLIKDIGAIVVGEMCANTQCTGSTYAAHNARCRADSSVWVALAGDIRRKQIEDALQSAAKARLSISPSRESVAAPQRCDDCEYGLSAFS